MVTISRLPDGAPPDTARALEQVVREVLDAAGEPLDVQLGTWRADDGRLQFVCRVEGPPADPFLAEPQWRWWSPLLDGPEDLRASLSQALDQRRRFPRGEGRRAAQVAAGSL